MYRTKMNPWRWSRGTARLASTMMARALPVPLRAGAGVLAGAWLGNRLQSRSGLTLWRLEQRNHALLEFAHRADADLNTVTRYFAPPIAGQNVTYNQILDAYFSLSGAGTLVQM